MDEHTPDEEENEAIERALRIAQLRAESETAAGTPIVGEDGASGSLEAQERFWSHIHAFETAPSMSLEDALRERCGYRAIPEDQLSTAQDCHAALWELLEVLASMRVYFHCIDHLSDRAFYNLLVKKVLLEETQIMPEGSDWNSRWDMSEFPTKDIPETNGIYLKYYADDAERDYWAHSFPEDSVPSKAERPFDRDRPYQVPPRKHSSHLTPAFSSSLPCS